MKNQAATLEQAKEILNTVKNNTLKEVLPINAINKKTSLYDSKFGGVPYLPKCDKLPTNKDGQQLRLLSQINFGDLPQNSLLPKDGILQFYVNDIYNRDFDNPTEQNDFRVVYYENIDLSIKEEDVINKIDDFESWDEDEDFPVQVEYKLEFKSAKEGISLQDYNFDKLFCDEYNKSFTNNTDDDIMDDLFDEEDEKRDDCPQHKIGGYPVFTQDDPRVYEKHLRRFDTILLQIDTQEDEDEEGIVWGDCGVCNFFINSEDLKNKDFSNVLFNWDCF